jgi:hypothetical protein
LAVKISRAKEQEHIQLYQYIKFSG